MGSSKSKTVQNNGDPQVNVMNTLEGHSGHHAEHEFKLWIVLCLNVAQILVIIYKWHQKRVT